MVCVGPVAAGAGAQRVALHLGLNLRRLPLASRLQLWVMSPGSLGEGGGTQWGDGLHIQRRWMDVCMCRARCVLGVRIHRGRTHWEAGLRCVWEACWCCAGDSGLAADREGLQRAADSPQLLMHAHRPHPRPARLCCIGTTTPLYTPPQMGGELPGCCCPLCAMGGAKGLCCSISIT